MVIPVVAAREITWNQRNLGRPWNKPSHKRRFNIKITSRRK
jgi:hypothetical protein